MKKFLALPVLALPVLALPFFLASCSSDVRSENAPKAPESANPAPDARSAAVAPAISAAPAPGTQTGAPDPLQYKERTLDSVSAAS